MLTIGNYVKAKTPEEAYELNQARSSRIMGGMMWMRLSKCKSENIDRYFRFKLDQIHLSVPSVTVSATPWPCLLQKRALSATSSTK